MTTALTPSPAAPTRQDSDATVQREVLALLARVENTKKRKNLERVLAALADMVARKERDFSLANVAKAIERLGLPGPKYQSLRNKDGADFRTLINVYREQYGRVPKTTDADSDEDLPLAISDVGVQQRVRVVLRQLRALETRNRLLHEQVARMAAQPALPALPARVTEPVGSFSDEERDAVRRFLDRMPSLGLDADLDTGAILETRTMREIAPPYFLDALRRIAGAV